MLGCLLFFPAIILELSVPVSDSKSVVFAVATANTTSFKASNLLFHRLEFHGSVSKRWVGGSCESTYTKVDKHAKQNAEFLLRKVQAELAVFSWCLD